MSSTTRTSRQGATARPPRGAGRLPFAIGILISVGAHAALLAWGVLDVPAPDDSDRFPHRVAPSSAPLPAPEPVLRVVRIQPPGVLPSGGGASGATSSPRIGAPESNGVPSRATPARVAARAAPTPEPGGPASLAVATPERLTIELADDAEPTGGGGATPAPTMRRPNRGIVVRGAGAPAGSGGRGVDGVGAGVAGGSGVTTIGRGGDCITPGIVVPESRFPDIGSLVTRRAGGGSPLRGRIGRIGGR